eukprot:jgi/Bigna1/34896/e_gw1.7.54.1
MSICGQPKRIIEYGHHVIIYEGYNKTVSAHMKEGGIYHNQYGHFLHEDFVGKEYGQKVRNWVIPMAPTPELWTKSLKQRTQILYQPDISLVLSFLSLKPGSVVFEAGRTGSGSLSTSIARTIAPHGHLHTFEFNEQRQKSAALEFKQNGMESLITCRHRNIVEKGFPLVDGGVDAVFLDLPNPWEVIDSASINLKSQGKICSFSPCIEQVQATCEALAKKKFKRTVYTKKRIFAPFRFTSIELWCQENIWQSPNMRIIECI